ncbi:MAG: hypothetical protein AB8H80_02360 [Planctomycetota bacterium]
MLLRQLALPALAVCLGSCQGTEAPSPNDPVADPSEGAAQKERTGSGSQERAATPGSSQSNSGAPSGRGPSGGDPTGGEIAPPPYTADQIRAAHPDGTLLRFRVTQGAEGAADAQQIVQLMRFENGDDDAADVVSWVESLNGERIVADRRQRSRWDELRKHGAFAAAKTARTRSSCTVPAGSYECWKYVVAGTSSDDPVSHFHFADSKPGPPVLLVIRSGNEQIMRMELLEYRPGS